MWQTSMFLIHAEALRKDVISFVQALTTHANSTSEPDYQHVQSQKLFPNWGQEVFFEFPPHAEEGFFAMGKIALVIFELQ